ncbi:hypothetical protein EVAR_69003_1 [Eumeta japonica]|uniref:Uncharacterized protein n=1 Tax=Eumeta variegata TaxID=151549 RepID=A0A4C1SM53_EUMVA|nr:hypothetical protein EVAR_69003_1 [Eumeta japonica]
MCPSILYINDIAVVAKFVLAFDSSFGILDFDPGRALDSNSGLTPGFETGPVLKIKPIGTQTHLALDSLPPRTYLRSISRTLKYIWGSAARPRDPHRDRPGSTAARRHPSRPAPTASCLPAPTTGRGRVTMGLVVKRGNCHVIVPFHTVNLLIYCAEGKHVVGNDISSTHYCDPVNT